MSLLIVIGIAIGLAMDAFAVAIASSVTLQQVNFRQIFRFSFHFGLFQAMMPIIGWFTGSSLDRYISTWDHWIAFGLLAFIGSKGICNAFQNKNGSSTKYDPTKGLSLVILSIATSIDALAVGLSFAVLDVSIWYPAIIIGIITAFLTMIGMQLGSRLGSRFGKRMEIFGGTVLLLIGVKILIEHLI